jgi:hypothetical protein
VSEASTAATGLPAVQDAMAVRRELDELLQVSASFTVYPFSCDGNYMAFGFSTSNSILAATSSEFMGLGREGPQYLRCSEGEWQLFPT